MKIKDLYTSALILSYALLTATACQQEHDDFMHIHEDTASLNLMFELTAPDITRSADLETTELFYEIKDGKMTPCEAPESIPATKAGNGDIADGGGMADLTVFLVDDRNDEIIARKSYSGLDKATAQHVNFLDLEPGEYTVYAYANTEGNDWFTMPSESETSFAPYKDALLKHLTEGIPSISNGRMPLTGKQNITVTGGDNSRRVSMLRAVGRLTVTAYNQIDDAITLTSPSFGSILPSTGYVFRHEDILPQSSSNQYHSIESDSQTHSVVPGSYHVIYETLMYESNADEDMQISMTYKGADYTFRENLSNRLQEVKKEPLLIKLYNNSGDSSKDIFLRLDQTSSGSYSLETVPVYDLDEKCFWTLSSSGRQQRGLTNNYYEVSLNMDDGLSFSKNVQTFKYGGSNDYTTIGEGSEQLTYDPATGEFSTSRNGSYFQFFTYVEDNHTGSIQAHPIKVLDAISNTMVPLTTIHRNQHIKMNIIFR